MYLFLTLYVDTMKIPWPKNIRRQGRRLMTSNVRKRKEKFVTRVIASNSIVVNQDNAVICKVTLDTLEVSQGGDSF